MSIATKTPSMPVSSASIETRNSRSRLWIEFHDESSASGTRNVVRITNHKVSNYQESPQNQHCNVASSQARLQIAQTGTQQSCQMSCAVHRAVDDMNVNDLPQHVG